MQQWKISAPVHDSQSSFFFLLPCSLYPISRFVHLAIIHCIPDLALCCIAQLPKEVLEIQNDLFQVCKCDRQKMEGRRVLQAASWIDAQSTYPFPRTPYPLPPECGKGSMLWRAAPFQGAEEGCGRYSELEV